MGMLAYEVNMSKFIYLFIVLTNQNQELKIMSGSFPDMLRFQGRSHFHFYSNNNTEMAVWCSVEEHFNTLFYTLTFYVCIDTYTYIRFYYQIGKSARFYETVCYDRYILVQFNTIKVLRYDTYAYKVQTIIFGCRTQRFVCEEYYVLLQNTIFFYNKVYI